MLEIYDQFKNYYGLTKKEEDDKEEKANNKFFNQLYPAFTQEISEILKNPNMTVSQFKK